MTGQRDYVFNGPVDLAALRDLDLRDCHLHFNGPFRLQDLAGVRLTDATVIINPQVPAQSPAPGHLSDNSQRKFVRESSFDYPPAGRLSGADLANPFGGLGMYTRKRARYNNVASGRQPSTSERASEDMTEGRLRYDDLEEGEIEPSQPCKRHASSTPVAVHPARAKMLEQFGDEDFPSDTIEVLVDRRTKANTAPMPFNRLHKRDRTAAGGKSKYGQEGFSQNHRGDRVAHDSIVNRIDDLPRAQIGVDEFLEETENALLQNQGRHIPARNSSWAITEPSAARPAVPSIRVALSGSPVSIVPVIASDQEDIHGVASNERRADDNAYQQNIKQELVGDVAGLHPINMPANISPPTTAELESATTNSTYPNNDGQETANEKDGIEQGSSSRQAVDPLVTPGCQLA